MKPTDKTDFDGVKGNEASEARGLKEGSERLLTDDELDKVAGGQDYIQIDNFEPEGFYVTAKFV